MLHEFSLFEGKNKDCDEAERDIKKGIVRIFGGCDYVVSDCFLRTNVDADSGGEFIRRFLGEF
jgi:hypothetical protein